MSKKITTPVVAIIVLAVYFVFLSNDKPSKASSNRIHLIDQSIAQAPKKNRNQQNVSNYIAPPIDISYDDNDANGNSSEVSANQANINTQAERKKLLGVRRISLKNIDQLKTAAIDKSPEVRTAVAERYRELEIEYEIEKNITRKPNQSGKFVPNMLENMLSEKDGFVLERQLDYLNEYTGINDSSVIDTLQELLKRPDLSANTLSKIAQLEMDKYNMDLEDIKVAFQDSPSISQMSEIEGAYLNDLLRQLVNERSQELLTP